MKYEKTLKAVFLLLFILLTGCVKPQYEPGDQEISSSKESFEGGTDFDMELHDPYAFSNIIKAYENLKKSGKVIQAAGISPTHAYIRFMPRNAEEIELLRKDSTLILFDHPLDCEPGVRNLCDNSTCVQNECTCQYCVVSLDKKLPGIRRKVIYHVFLPPDENASKGLSPGLIRLYSDLEYESTRLTGNIEEDGKSENEAKGSSAGWTPKGTIRVWDDLIGEFIPLAHVNVHARWFTRIERATTDENGFFRMKQFRNRVNYSIKWENSLFTIRNGSLVQAWYNGPKMKGDWNLDISNGKSLMFATIHRAAIKSFYGDNLGTSRPSLKNGGRTKICYIDENGKGEFWGDWTAGGIIPDIKIWGKAEGVYKPTNKIYGSTVHELAHQAHSQHVGNVKYWSASKMIRESWADAVEWALSNDEYHKLGKKYRVTNAINYNHYYNTHNRWPYVKDKDYSPIFIDLVDQLNQRIIIGKGYPNDMVAGYTLSYLNYNMLEKCSDINTLHSEVKLHKLEDVTDYKIDELFYLYQ